MKMSQSLLISWIALLVNVLDSWSQLDHYPSFVVIRKVSDLLYILRLCELIHEVERT
jgi:hypothetical protein